jgi:DNA-binding IclR family transcriptional regulator
MLLAQRPAGREVAGAQTISRAIRVLQLIATHAPDGVRLVDVARAMALERPTAHRLLKALTVESMVVQDARTRRYSLGPMLFELGLSATHQFNLKEVAQPVVAQLAEETGDTTFLFLRSGHDAVCISRMQGSYPIQTPSVPLGSRQPLGVSAGGLALLAALPQEEIATVVQAIAPRLGAYGELDADIVLQLCARARRSGYAVTGNHAVPGVRAIGLPILNAAKSPIAAITVAATLGRMTDQRIAALLPKLRHAARELTRLLHQ